MPPGASSPGGFESPDSPAFDGPPNPLNLTRTLATESATAAEIGPDGGTLTATGPDGTTYRLDIPAQAVPFSTQVEMTPLADVTGFPFDAPEHRLGVELAPEGLHLLAAATLTIAPPGGLPRAGIATMDYLEDGRDASLVIHEETGDAVRIPMWHFSGWVAMYPIDDVAWRTMVNAWQSEVTKEFESDVAMAVGVQRQKEFLGIDAPSLLEDLEEHAKRYTEKVLDGYVLRAGQGCAEATRAFTAFLDYERTIAEAGYEDDPALARPIPPDVLRLRWKLCARDEYERCAQTGDLPRLVIYLIEMIEPNSRAAIANPEADGQAMLEACAHFIVQLTTLEDAQGKPGYERMEAERMIELTWHPGSGAFGIQYATIEGTGPVDPARFESDFHTPECGKNVATVTPLRPASATLTGIAFNEPPWYAPTAAPMPRYVKLHLTVGTVNWQSTNTCGSNGPFAWAFGDAIKAIVGPDSLGLGFDVEKDWQFDFRPFRSFWSFDGTVHNAQIQGDTTVGAELLLKHDPKPLPAGWGSSLN